MTTINKCLRISTVTTNKILKLKPAAHSFLFAVLRFLHFCIGIMNRSFSLTPRSDREWWKNHISFFFLIYYQVWQLQQQNQQICQLKIFWQPLKYYLNKKFCKGKRRKSRKRHAHIKIRHIYIFAFPNKSLAKFSDLAAYGSISQRIYMTYKGKQIYYRILHCTVCTDVEYIRLKMFAILCKYGECSIDTNIGWESMQQEK